MNTIFYLRQAKAEWWNDEWTYRKKVTITNDSTPRTDYQVSIVLDTATLITAGKMRSDCGDLRLFTSTHTQLTDYDLISCNSDQTVVAFKDTFAASEARHYYLYYGNPQAASVEAGDRDTLYEFHDNFAGTTIRPSTYSSGGGGTVAQNDELSITNDNGVWDQYFFKTATDTRAAGKTLYARFKAENGLSAMIGWHDPGTGASFTDLVYAIYFNNGTFDVYEDNNNRACGSCTTYTEDLYYDIKIELKSTGALYYVKAATSTSWTQIYDSSYSSETPLHPGIAHNNSGLYSYTDDWIIFTNTANAGLTVSTASEEYTPGPVVRWKFDEGSAQTIAQPLTKNEQQLNILDHAYESFDFTDTYGPTDNSLGTIYWDADKYTSATVYFEAVLKDNQNDGGLMYASLWTTGASPQQVSGSEIYDDSDSSYDRIRSGALTLTDNTTYTVRVKDTSGTLNTLGIKAARLIVVQTDAAKITDTQTQIEIGNAESQISITATALSDKKIWSYDATKYNPAPTAYFEATLRSAQPTIEQQINILDRTYESTDFTSSYSPSDDSLGIIYWDADRYPGATVYFEAVLKDNQNDGGFMYASLWTTGVGAAQVNGSEVYDTDGGSDYDRERSSAITLTDNTTYTVRVKDTSGTLNTLGIKAARLIVVQTDAAKITDTRTQIEVGNYQTAFTNTSAAALTDYKIYQYNAGAFTPSVESTGDVAFTATLKIDNSEDTVYAELFNCGSPCNPASGQVVATLSHTGDTNFTLKTASNIDGDADWDTTNDDEYIVRVYCAEGGTGGCSGNISNAKITLDQTAAGGITALETYQQEVNSLATDASTTYNSDLDFLNYFNPDLDTGTRSFAGGSFNFYLEATMKVSAGTGAVQIKNNTEGTAISGSEVTSTSTSYERKRSSAITSSLPQYPIFNPDNLDTQAKNTGGITSVSNSWVIVQVSNLATGAITAYADLYDTTSGQVSGSEVSTTSASSASRQRSGALTLTTGHEYIVRIKSSSNGVPVYLANAKVILDQSDSSGIKAVETVHQMVNAVTTQTGTAYVSKDFLNQLDPANNFVRANYNTANIYFETTMKTSNGDTSHDAYAILAYDTSTEVASSALTTGSTDYARVRTNSSIAADLPTTVKTYDTRLKNEAASNGTTSVANSWLIIQNNNTLPYGTHDSTSNQLHANLNNSPAWKTGADCRIGNCLSFDGVNDYVITADTSKLDFAAADSFTVGMWVKRTQKSSGTEVLLAKYLSSTGTDGGYKIIMESDGDITVGIDDDSTWEPDASVTSTAATYDDNNWHYVTMVKSSNSTLALYIDSTLISSVSISGVGTLANTDSLYLAIDGDGSTNPFKGLIDEVKIYPYARSESEIKTDAVNGAPKHGASAVFGTKDESNLTNGLVGYWKMDDTGVDAEGETSTDMSGNGNNGILYGDNGVGDNGTGMNCTANGKFGTGCDFDGTDDNVIIDGDAGLNISDKLTITAWVKADANTGTVLFRGANDGNYGNYRISINNTDNLVFSFRNQEGTGSVGSTSNSSYTWTDNWHFVTAALTFGDNTTFRLYLDGELIPSTPWTSGASTLNDLPYQNSTTLTIGNRGTNTTDYYDGLIDEARVYNRMLSPNEINRLYNWAPGPVGYWKLDENTGTTTTYDSSGSGNNGTMYGSMTADDWVEGKFGSALNFDGSNDYVGIGDSNLWNSSDDLTVSFWMKGNTSDASDVIISRWNETPWKRVWNIAYNSNSGDIRFDTSVNGSFNPANLAVSTTTLTDKTWYHVAVVHNSADTTNKIYINGSLDQNKTGVDSAIYDIDIGIYLAHSPQFAAAESFYDGTIDDVKIYNYVRTPGQIVEDMNAGHPAPGSPVGSALGHWKFDEGYGDTANNNGSGGSSINGDLAGGTSCPQSGDSACPTWTNDGKIGKALNFDTSGTTDDYVSMPDNTSLDPGDGNWTISVWAKPANSDQATGLVCKRQDSSPYPQYCLGIGGTDSYTWPSGKRVIFTYYSDFTTSARTGYTDRDIADGNWHHFAAVADKTADTIRIYVDGKEESITKDHTIGSWPNVTNSEVLRVGHKNNTGSGYFNGPIDEVKIYNLALTADQVKQEFNQGEMAVFGSTSTDSSGVATWSDTNAYCPPGQGSSCTAPVAEWKFDEKTGTTINDTSGNGNVGTLTNPPTWSRGKIGQALNFNGSSNYVTIDSSFTALDGKGAMTVSAWVKPAFASSVGSRPNRTVINRGTWTTPGISFRDDGSQYYIECDMYNSTGTNFNASTAFDANPNWSANTWHFVACRYTGNELELFWDNQLIASDINATGTIHNTSANMNIGSAGTQQYFMGLIDDIKIYDYSRTLAQIAWEYNQGGPVGWWKFDECSGVDIGDSSVTDNHGTLTIGSSPTNTSAGSCSSGVSTEAWNNGTSGKRNASIDFDGTDDWASIADRDAYSLNTSGQLSVSFWYKPSVVTDPLYLVNKRAASNYEWDVRTGASGAIRAFILQSDNTVYMEATSGTGILQAGNWYHIMFTADSSSPYLRLYVNGKLVAEDTTTTGSIINGTATVTIAKDGAGATYVDGLFDDVKIFNYALTAQQVKDVTNDGAVHFGP